MSSDASKRDRANGIATTNGHPSSTAKNDGGSMSETRTQNLDSMESQTYGLDPHKNKSAVGSFPPRNQQVYNSNTTDRPARSSTREHSPAVDPPVTKGTLSELDVNKIVNNPKLRHDINFDPDLHFRPNLDGEKGRRKTQRANDFWETMRPQLRSYITNRDQFEKELGDADWCLPATLKAIRGILETLVPQRDRASVEETFNVDLLMQQFRKGVADLEKLALWLSQLLKCHCAPMRDNWVDEMVIQLSNGDRNGDVTLLVAGMQNLLGVLDAMKLDVANHQIRCLRPLLIEDTVHFEQKFFMKKIALGRVDIAGAHAWFRRANNLPNILPTDGTTHSQGNTWDFIKALVNLTVPSKSSEMVPHIFLFDEERLIKLRSDMLDLINMEICMYLYRNLDAQSKPQDMRYVAREDTPTIPVFTSRPTSPADDIMLSSPTDHLIQTLSGMVGDAHVVPSSCPRSSPSTSTPGNYPPTPLNPSQPFANSASQVRASLAILSSSTINDRLTALPSSLALQILRSTTTLLMRITHIGILHWTDWIPLAYNQAFSNSNHRLYKLSKLGLKLRGVLYTDNGPSQPIRRGSRYLELASKIISSALQSGLSDFPSFRLFASLVLFSTFTNASPLEHNNVIDQSPFSLTTFFSNRLASSVFFCLVLKTVSRSKDLLSKVIVGLLLAILFIIAGSLKVDQVAGFVLSFLALLFVFHRKCSHCNMDGCDGNCGPSPMASNQPQHQSIRGLEILTDAAPPQSNLPTNAGASMANDTSTSIDGGIRELKPPKKKKTVYVWECCRCSFSGIDIQIGICPDCEAPRCAYCQTTRVQVG